MITARFFVTKSFPVRQSNLFVLTGKILEGKVRAGMQIPLALNPSLNTTLTIHSVEFVDDIEKGEGEVGLTVKYESGEELDDLLFLNVENEEIKIQEASAVNEEFG